MASVLVVFPMIVPLVAALCALVWRAQPRVAHGITLAGSVVHVGCVGVLCTSVLTRGPLVHQFGGWAAPFGIVYVADAFAVFFLSAIAIVSCTVFVHAFGARGASSWEPFFLMIVVGGASGAVLTSDFFHLFVCFEVMLIAVYALMAVQSVHARERMDRTMRYVVLNAANSLLFLLALGVLYGTVGTLNMAHAIEVGAGSWRYVLLAMFGVVFALKAGLGLAFWLPQAYAGLSIGVAALFAGLMTKIGLYALVRIGMVWGIETSWIGWIAVAAIAGGVLGMFVQRTISGILAYQIIISSGMLGLALACAHDALLVLALSDMVAKTMLFLLFGTVARSDRIRAEHARMAPMLVWCGVLVAGGLPPFGPFVAKALLLFGLVERTDGGDVAMRIWLIVAAGASLAVLLSLIRVAMRLTWSSDQRVHMPVWTRLAVVLLLVVLCGIGLGADRVVTYARTVVLTDAHVYVKTVLGR